MPMLTELRLESCEGINSSSMAALSHCTMLEVRTRQCAVAIFIEMLICFLWITPTNDTLDLWL